jgi:hypothetical protein
MLYKKRAAHLLYRIVNLRDGWMRSRMTGSALKMTTEQVYRRLSYCTVQLKSLLDTYRRITCSCVENKCRVRSYYLRNRLKMRKVSARLVQHHLTPDQTELRLELVNNLFPRFESEGQDFLSRIKRPWRDHTVLRHYQSVMSGKPWTVPFIPRAYVQVTLTFFPNRTWGIFITV